MNRRLNALLLGALAVLAANNASAQVGHEPAKSPYQDLEYSQEFTVYAGRLRARHDPAGIAPRSRPMLGVRYELGLTGPLVMSADLLGAFGTRTVLDPTKPVATRQAGEQKSGVYAADIALAMNLTGTRTWHDLVPQVRAGLGFVHSGAKDDSTGFAFGTPFAFTYGGGVKFVPGHGRFQIRADITDRVFKLHYPDAYYRITSDNTAVLPATTVRDFYTHHTALTVGVSYLFAR